MHFCLFIYFPAVPTSAHHPTYDVYKQVFVLAYFILIIT